MAESEARGIDTETPEVLEAPGSAPTHEGKIVKAIYRRLHALALRMLSSMGLNVARTSDFYSPLPVLSDLEKHRERWDRPSEMVGVNYDLDRMKDLLTRLVEEYARELPSYEEAKKMQYGPGFTIVDAMTLYFMLRDLKPKRYIEIGSGLSTYYSWLALSKNKDEGAPCDISCVDPYPTGRLQSLAGVSMTESLVQDVDLKLFDQLDAGDVLFIDSTHVVKIDGDVPYLYLEVIPRLKPGVVIHAHDIAFPYNTPYPSEQYVFLAKWPLYRTEAMLLQAFLSYNPSYEIVLCTPMLRFFCEDFLAETLPGYQPVDVTNFDTHFGSLWWRRVE